MSLLLGDGGKYLTDTDVRVGFASDAGFLNRPQKATKKTAESNEGFSGLRLPD